MNDILKFGLTVLVAWAVGVLITSWVMWEHYSKHECPVPFRDYMPDPIASQVYLGLEPDGKPYKAFGKKWVRLWLDQDTYRVMVNFGLDNGEPK